MQILIVSLKPFLRKGVTGYVPRIESFALAASEEVTKGSLVVGIDPTLEKNHSDMEGRVSEGEYITKDDEADAVGQVS